MPFGQNLNIISFIFIYFWHYIRFYRQWKNASSLQMIGKIHSLKFQMIPSKFQCHATSTLNRFWLYATRKSMRSSCWVVHQHHSILSDLFHFIRFTFLFALDFRMQMHNPVRISKTRKHNDIVGIPVEHIRPTGYRQAMAGIIADYIRFYYSKDVNWALEPSTSL